MVIITAKSKNYFKTENDSEQEAGWNEIGTGNRNAVRLVTISG